MDYSDDVFEELVQLARLSLTGRRQDIQLYIRRIANKMKPASPKTFEKLNELITKMPSNTSPFRSENMESIPVDSDTRFQLIRFEDPVSVSIDPIWEDSVANQLRQIILEQGSKPQLFAEGLAPTRTLLFVGKPGVGKTLAARWLAKQLNVPLLILDLSSVMSSFLGKTGNNIRSVLDYAKGCECILLIDELDAVAKRRDDAAEIGELKRLVTVLLQEIDDWPPTGLLIAATNHPDLLDPAIWRRFDVVVNFPMPEGEKILKAIDLFIAEDDLKEDRLKQLMAYSMSGLSFSDIEREIHRFRRESIIRKIPLEKIVEKWIIGHSNSIPRNARKMLTLEMSDNGYSQREIQELIGVSRDTIRKFQKAFRQGDHNDAKKLSHRSR